MSAAKAPSFLIIDDEKGFRDLLGFELQGRGYQVESVVDGEAALKKIGERSFDVALCDFLMSPWHGLQTLTRLKQASPAMEVIVITGMPTEGLAQEAAQHGAFATVRKPFELDELMRVLEGALKKARGSEMLKTHDEYPLVNSSKDP